MKDLHEKTKALLTSLGYRKIDTVWTLGDRDIGLIIGRSYTDQDNNEKLHIQVYHFVSAESGYRIETTDIDIVFAVIRNIHFLNTSNRKENKKL